MTKCKYEVENKPNVIVYSFVTTTRNTEDCINLMVEKYKGYYRGWVLYRTMEGKREEVHRVVMEKVEREYGKVMDVKTKEVYNGIRNCARANKVSQSTVLRHVNRELKEERPRWKYV